MVDVNLNNKNRGLKRWFLGGIFFSILVGVCAYLLKILNSFDIKIIIGILIIGFVLIPLMLVILKKFQLWKFFIRGIICSVIVGVCAYLLDIIKLFDIKTTIIALLVIGFALSTLIGIFFKKKKSSPEKFKVRGFAG